MSTVIHVDFVHKAKTFPNMELKQFYNTFQDELYKIGLDPADIDAIMLSIVQGQDAEGDLVQFSDIFYQHAVRLV